MLALQVFSRIIAAALVLSLTSPLLLAAPVSAGTLSWTAEAIPGTRSTTLGPRGVDVRDIAVATDGTVIYAVPGDSVSDNVIYESTDAGMSWMALAVEIKADLVAIAPDDSKTLAIASSSTPAVYVSTNGGSTWYSLGTPQESGGAAAVAIYDIAISTASDGERYIAAAGREAGNVGNVWYFKVGSTPSAWKETNNLAGFSSTNSMKAVAFSPGFSSDRVIIAVGERQRVG